MYLDVVLDFDAIAARYALSPELKVHENTDPRSALERGLVCSVCCDVVMGRVTGERRFPCRSIHAGDLSDP